MLYIVFSDNRNSGLCSLNSGHTVELAAAVAHARRRRLGPFRTVAADPARVQKELAAFARAGFSRDMALRALRMDPEAAETLLRAAREA